MKIIFSFILIILISLNLNAAIVSFQPEQGKVGILAIGYPSALKIKGEGSGPTGNLDLTDQGIKGELEFTLDTLDTGIKTRNEHMKKKYLQTETYPKAKLTITKVDFLGKDIKQNFELENAKFEGILSLHGVEKKIDGITTINRKNSLVDVKANFKINIKDYSIDLPSFAGITVTENVEVTVNTKANIQ